MDPNYSDSSPNNNNSDMGFVKFGKQQSSERQLLQKKNTISETESDHKRRSLKIDAEDKRKRFANQIKTTVIMESDDDSSESGLRHLDSGW